MGVCLYNNNVDCVFRYLRNEFEIGTVATSYNPFSRSIMAILHDFLLRRYGLNSRDRRHYESVLA